MDFFIQGPTYPAPQDRFQLGEYGIPVSVSSEFDCIIVGEFSLLCVSRIPQYGVS